jgi:hypothetical protein
MRISIARTVGTAVAGAWLALLVVAPDAAAGERASRPSRPGDTVALTGNLRLDLFGGAARWMDVPALPADDAPLGLPSKRSPWLGAGFSLLVPGTGQIYAESYWKAALFLAVEAVAVAAAISYNQKGHEQTASYQTYADQNWSVVAYARWTEGKFNPPAGEFQWDQGGGQVNWDELNRMERWVAANGGQWYSHTLPPYGQQQYYELIGKYPQYNQGWDDAPPDFNYGDPLTPNFIYYSGERGLANDYYSKRSTAVTVAVINHILSAADAAWSVSLYNNDLQARAGLRLVPVGAGFEGMPVLQLSCTF